MNKSIYLAGISELKRERKLETISPAETIFLKLCSAENYFSSANFPIEITLG